MLKIVGECLYNKKRAGNALQLVMYCVLIFLCTVIIAELVFNLYFLSIYVEGDSMLPTLTGASAYDGAGGDYIFVDIQAAPEFQDIVVLKKKDGDRREYNIIKRAIAFEGDAVRMYGGRLEIRKKGESQYKFIDEPYVDPENNHPNRLCNNFEEHIVGEGGIFLMGDNRDDSHDSRLDGDYSIEDIVGVVTDWSMQYKAQITGVYTFFKYTIPKSLNLIN